MTASVTASHYATHSEGWRWAPTWVLLFVALWPLPAYAEAVLALGALAALAGLVKQWFRNHDRYLSNEAWALTCVLFVSYWGPELISALDAVNPKRAWEQVAADLRYLPFLWLAASAVSHQRGRRIVFNGLAMIVAIWTLDALIQAAFGTSPLFWVLDMLKQSINGRRLCPAEDIASVERLSGIFGNCNLKLGLVLASLSPFCLFAAGRVFGWIGWLLTAAAIGAVILLAGARAAWLTYALVLVFSGWRWLNWKQWIGEGAVALALSVVLVVNSPQLMQRVVLTTTAFSGNQTDVDAALSGRVKIWRAADCMINTHPINGVGVRNFRDVFPACDQTPNVVAAWGDSAALHAHQLLLEILAETGVIGLFLWLAGAALAWRAWRCATMQAREHARPAMVALAVTMFPFNTHLAVYSTFWGGLTLLLTALYAGSLLPRRSI